MKVLVLNGSPKEKSDTMCLTNSFLKGLNKNNEFDINIIHLIKKNIKPCLGCFKCWKNEEGLCVQDDDQKAIMDEYQKADIVIYSFPLYSYAMPSHLKAFVDRLSKIETKVFFILLFFNTKWMPFTIFTIFIIKFIVL